MKTRFIPFPCGWIILAAGLLAPVLHAEVKLGSPFTSHMVLQREMPVPVWGAAEPGEAVTVEFAGQKKSATADAAGKWLLKLDPLAASREGREFKVAGSKTAAPLALGDVLVGEVWLASGQSNMVFTIAKARYSWAGLVNEAEEIAAADYPLIRMFTAAEAKTYAPQPFVGGEWQVCSPATAPNFSALGYLFARDLFKRLDVPVGIVTAAYGASCAEAWMSREAAAADPKIRPYLAAFDASYKAWQENPQATAAEAPPRPKTLNSRPGNPNARLRDPVQDQHFPTVLFNGMLNPLIPYAIRGAIWYQGESIIGGTPGLNLYGHVQREMVRDWRARWGQGDFPFFLVQLPGQQNLSNNPRVREEQAAVLALPNTGMAVAIDVGEARDVHPHNKAPVADRLARLALAKVYGRKIEHSGPVFQAVKIEGGAARVSFTEVGAGLAARGGESLKGFQIAGADRKFAAAEAKIDGAAIIVGSPEVPAPVAVRYAWDNYPEGLGCNLVNAAGLPAAPFRTDTWDYPIEGITEN